MHDTHSGLVLRAWQGAGGTWFAQLKIEATHSFVTVQRRSEFREGERVPLTRQAGLYQLADRE